MENRFFRAYWHCMTSLATTSLRDQNEKHQPQPQLHNDNVSHFPREIIWQPLAAAAHGKIFIEIQI